VGFWREKERKRREGGEMKRGGPGGDGGQGKVHPIFAN